MSELFDVQVELLDGSPASHRSRFVWGKPQPGNAESSSASRGERRILPAVWMGTNTGISGASVIGNLNITLPSGVGANSAQYRIVDINFFSVAQRPCVIKSWRYGPKRLGDAFGSQRVQLERRHLRQLAPAAFRNDF